MYNHLKQLDTTLFFCISCVLG